MRRRVLGATAGALRALRSFGEQLSGTTTAAPERIRPSGERVLGEVMGNNGVPLRVFPRRANVTVQTVTPTPGGPRYTPWGWVKSDDLFVWDNRTAVVDNDDSVQGYVLFQDDQHAQLLVPETGVVQSVSLDEIRDRTASVYSPDELNRALTKVVQLITLTEPGKMPPKDVQPVLQRFLLESQSDFLNLAELRQIVAELPQPSGYLPQKKIETSLVRVREIARTQLGMLVTAARATGERPLIRRKDRHETGGL
ncbi:MAG: hypothetical protein HYV60_05185 [Planctomycetia bacterium]|nr:hypothetical protein [Planctomycetia bacterium]